MSLRINTNVSAMRALTKVTHTDEMLAKSVQKLSSGLRISSAADDPAGLVVSEGFRATIRGIETANRNSQDAINMAKTADGALGETSRMLLSLRALATAAANVGSSSQSEIQGIQAQATSILASLDRIADTTTWGDRKLLSGASGTMANITATNSVTSITLKSTFDGKPVRAGGIDLTRVTAATQSATTLGRTFASLGTSVPAGVFAINGTTFTVQAGDTVQSVLDKVNSQSSATNVMASFTPGSGITLTSTKYGSNYQVRYTESDSVLNNGAVATAPAGIDAEFDVTVPTGNSPATSTVRFTGGVGATDDGLTLTAPDGEILRLTATGNATSARTTIGALVVGDMRFQIGAGATDSVQFGIPSAKTNALGNTIVTGKSLADIDMTTAQGAEEAIKMIDQAVEQISAARAKLGTFQTEILESNVRSLQVAQENLTASDSLVRDLDVAAEMTEYTKLNILRQSGVSILAQASKLPESVLELLRG